MEKGRLFEKKRGENKRSSFKTDFFSKERLFFRPFIKDDLTFLKGRQQLARIQTCCSCSDRISTVPCTCEVLDTLLIYRPKEKSFVGDLRLMDHIKRKKEMDSRYW